MTSSPNGERRNDRRLGLRLGAGHEHAARVGQHVVDELCLVVAYDPAAHALVEANAPAADRARPQSLMDERTSSGDGHGLGLSILRAIVDVHGAVVNAEPQQEGGLRVAVVFPPRAT